MEYTLGILVVLGIASGATCAMIAFMRGVSPGGWFVLGLLLNVPAILFVAIAQPTQYAIEQKGLQAGTHRKCDYCAEVVKREAVKCRYCASPLEVKEPPQKRINLHLQDSTKD